MLKIEHLSKTFNEKKVLDNVSLSVNHGQIALLLGPSGGGKSTLLRILNNLETPDEGTITLDGKLIDLSTIHKNHLVGMVFQQFHLFEHLTVAQNITLALEKVVGKSKAEAEEIAMKLLRDYGLDDKAHDYPASLSGGQKQRLALARALALQPKIICLDEPTSALDPVLTSYVAQIIEGLAAKNYIVIITTHDTQLVEKLDCMVHLLKDGKIVETANSKMLYDHPERYPQLSNFIAGV